MSTTVLLLMSSAPCWVHSAQADPTSGTWLELNGLPRTEQSAIFDPIRNRFIIFGGISGSAAQLLRNDVWTLDLDDTTPHWALLTTNGTPPPPRFGHVAVYDPDRDRMVIYGGRLVLSSCFYSDYASDSWALELGSVPEWKQLPTGSGPALGTGSTAIYDPLRQRMVVYGGFSRGCLCGGTTDQIWSLALGTNPAWTQISPVNPIGMPPPGMRSDHVAVYDPAGDRMLVFGGRTGDGCYPVTLGDVWSLSLGATPEWTPVNPTGTPPAARYGHVGVYDSAHQRMIVFGGTGPGFSGAWALELQGGPSWTALAPSGAPPTTTANGGGAYDPLGDRLLYQAGRETFALHLGDSPAWEPLDVEVASTPPTARAKFASILDPVRRRLILFGGYDGHGVHNDTWAMDIDYPHTWRQLQPAGPPPSARTGGVAVYDPHGDRMVLFGANASINDTWALNFSPSPAWVELHPSGTLPYGRYFSSAVYDPVHSAMVIFGGFDGYATYLNDVWSLPLDEPPAWTKLNPGGTAPTTRYKHAAVYDAVGVRMLVFGGAGPGNPGSSDTWALSLGDEPTWSPVAPGGSLPQGRLNASAVYDSQGERMVVYGGMTGESGSTLGDVWSLALGPAPAWMQLSPAGTGPGPRSDHCATYDSLEKQMVVFGGYANSSDGSLRNDAWFLSWKDGSTPALISLLSASSEIGMVRLRWYSAEPGAHANVYRRTDATDWERVALLDADGSGFLDFEDRDIQPGGRYGYRLGIPDGEQQVFAGETWVVVPALQLALHGARPNPASGRTVSAAFTLPSGAPAVLELFDVAGRLVLSRQVGELGPGLHEVRLDPGGQLRAGIYVIRLTQGVSVFRAKVVVLP